MFFNAFYACTKIREIAFSNHDTHIITIDDVQQTFHNGQPAFEITFHSYKHSKAPVIIVLQPQPSPLYCPVNALQCYLLVRPKCMSSFLFLDQSGRPVSRLNVSLILKTCLSLTGRNPTVFNTHSFRIGRATQLACDNATDNTIKSVGRWNSNAFKSYVRPSKVTLPQ